MADITSVSFSETNVSVHTANRCSLIGLSYGHNTYKKKRMITLETTGDAFGPSFSGRRRNSSPESESGGPVPVESDHMSANNEHH